MYIREELSRQEWLVPIGQLIFSVIYILDRDNAIILKENKLNMIDKQFQIGEIFTNLD